MSSEAYKIRGHHLGYFADIIKGVNTPEESAELIADNVKNNVNGELYYLQSYAEDVLGPKLSLEERFKKGLTFIFTQFIELRPEATVTITTGERDGICKSCAIGAHCVDIGQELAMNVDGQLLRAYPNQIEDMMCVDRFLELGRLLVSKGTIKKDLAESCKSDSRKPLARHYAIPVETNKISYQTPVTARADYVKTVLEHWE